MENEIDEKCCLCGKEADFDDYFCDHCVHYMWENSDEIRAIIGAAVGVDNCAEVDYDITVGYLSRAIENLRCKMRCED